MTSTVIAMSDAPESEPEAREVKAAEEARKADPGDAPLLFCPFCRECFEGEELCPDHELALVPFVELPKRLDVDDTPADDERLAMYDFRYGRGGLFGASLMGLVGFVLPMVTTASTEDTVVSTGMEVASRVAPNLFVIPAISLGIVSILFRRRTLRAMRGARVVVPAMASVGIFSLAYTLYRIREGAVQLSEQLGVSVSIEPDAGVWVMALAMAATVIFGFRMGGVKRDGDGLPHGAGPDDGGGGIVVDE